MSCHGGCCAAFTLTPSMEEWGEHRLEAEEEAYIADMVIEITAGEAVMRLAAFGAKPPGPKKLTDGTQYYRCRHWDEGTRLCREYESRPDMCRNYPGYRGSDKVCEHCGCG